MWLISDLHGCYYTFLRLLAKLPSGEPIVFCGDLIDRGPNSKQMVEYAMKHKIPTVMGNHEHLALSHHGRIGPSIYSDAAIWYMNGGINTFKSYFGDPLPNDPTKWRLSDDILDWMQALPYFLEYEELLVSHTGHGKDTKAKSDIFGREEPRDMLLWYRDTHFENDGKYRVFGHTQEAEPVITDKWAMIDSGAAYAGRGYGTMTAFHWPSKVILQQKYDETPIRA